VSRAGEGAAGLAAGGALALHVERRGQGPPLVLLHGFGASRFTFRLWADELARTHTVHLMDIFGFGAAPPPADGRYGPVEQAETVVRWLRREDVRGAVLVGHSLGGGVALLVALRLAELGERERVKALISVAGPAYPQAIPRYIGLARVPLLGRLLFALAGPERIVRKVLRYIIFDRAAVTEEQVEGYAAPLRRPRTRTALVETARQIVPEGLDRMAARFPEIRLPVLLLWGRHDLVIPLWVAKRLERDLPSSKLVVLERCGHVPEEQPEQSLSAVREFLSRI
jgi:pimeloyl-ACP methyl ester carboxylesterase